MSERMVRQLEEVDRVLLAVRHAREVGRLGAANYGELLDWFRRVRVELATEFDGFGTRVRSISDFFRGKITRMRSDIVAGSRLTVIATLDTRTQTVWVVSLDAE